MSHRPALLKISSRSLSAMARSLVAGSLIALFAIVSTSCETNNAGGAPQEPMRVGDAQQGTAAPTGPGRFGHQGNAQPAPPAANAPNITARNAILVDNRGRVLFEKNADARVPTASTQKLLLGLLIAERGNLSSPVTVQDVDTWAEPTVMGIKPGQVYTREALLRAVLIRSSNDIARTLARDHSGSVPAFAAAMNNKAQRLGMRNSYFTNASGLPTPSGQYSTARDLSVLGFASLRNPFVRNAVGTKVHVFRFSNGTTKTVYNTNQVLKHFPYCTGLKTGYTNAAGRCLVSSASANGKTVVAVILGSKTPNVWSESEALLRYGLGM